MKTAWIFPGQGSQATGMGADLGELPEAQTRFAQAEQILGWSVPELCQGDLDRLSQTLYTQPCLYTIECILVDLLYDKEQQPNFLAGHSLGEYVALYAAGVFDFESGLRLVKRRAELMAQASGGGMVALMGFDREQLEQTLAQTPDVVLANDNNATQVVISGSAEAIEAIMAAVKTKRAVQLNVSGAFHSPFMQSVAAAYEQVLAPVSFSDAKFPVLPNVEPEPIVEGTLIKARLIQQMTGSVRWRETALKLQECGVEQAVEIGPGKVLTNLIKRTCVGMDLRNISSVADLSR